jgi:hypothetical protein
VRNGADCTATDDTGDAASCTHTVTVADTTPAVVIGDGITGTLWPA